MIYTVLTNRALRIAYDAHQGQVDKAGFPYIFHPFHLAEQMTDEISTCVALLHDVAEDTDVSLDELAREFPSEVMEPLRKLTHRPGSSYADYIVGLRDDPVARKVKMADIRHNSNMSRFAGSKSISLRDAARLAEKYEMALALLAEGNSEI